MNTPIRNAISTDNITKTYPLPGKRGKRTAVDGLTLQVPEGQVFAFLGPNGAGKTTTIKMLLGFIRPTSGSAAIFGQDVSIPDVRRDVGYLPEQPYFHKFLTPRETLSLHAALLGLGRRESKEQIDHAISIAGLAEHGNVRVSKLSKGLMQRVGIAQALLGNPKLLILDEPTSGLDPIGRHEMKDLIASLKNTGVTIFLSSHLLSEVEAVCDTVAILSKGKLVCLGRPDEIKHRTDSMRICCEGVTDEAIERLSTIGECALEEGADRAVVRVDTSKVFDALKAVEAYNMTLISVAPQQETLEDVFMRLAA
jgi:ABC-2 type transport system ATP-binding protein